jgi:ABC-type multidrug transport system fused ATPase/permease subunit
MKHILRIYRSIFKWAPFSAVFTVIDYINGGIVPAVITVISVNMFDRAARVLGGEPPQNGLYFYAGLYLGIYLVNDLFSFVRSITLNAGIYERGTAFFRIELYEKLATLPLVNFENAELLNRKERAEKAVNDETLSAIFNHSMRFVRAGVQVIGVAAVLSSYSMLLLPLSVLSVLPYLFARAIRGKEFIT